MSSNSKKPPQGKPAAKKKGMTRGSTQPKKVGTSLPDVKYNVGNAQSNKMSDAVSNVVAEAQMTGMTGSSCTTPVTTLLSGSKIYPIAQILAHKVCVVLSGEAKSLLSSTSFTPASLVMYLVWALFDSLRKSGTFQNAAMVNAFPPFPDAYNIPVSWAYVLAHLKPYQQGTVSFSFDDTTTLNLPTPPTNTAVGPEGTSFCLSTTSTYSAGSNFLANGEQPRDLGVATSWVALFSQGAYLSDVFARAMAIVKYQNLPTVAPDASAYAVNAGIGFACNTPNFQPEVSICLINYGASNPVSSTQLYMKPTPVIPAGFPIEFSWVETLQLCDFLPRANLPRILATHTWNSAEFAEKKSKFGRVHKRTTDARNNNVRHLFLSSYPLDPRCYETMVAAALGALAPNGSYTPTQLYVWGVVCMSALVAKVMPYSYVSNYGMIIDTRYDSQFADMDLPLSVVAVLNTIGPVVVDGRLMHPVFCAGAHLAGSWIGFSTQGLTAVTNLLYASLYAGTNQQNIGVLSASFDSTTYASLGSYPSTPVCTTDMFLTVFQQIVGPTITSTSGGASSGGVLIKPDSHNPVGKSNVFAMADVSVVVSNGMPLNPTITAKVSLVGSVGSFKCLAGDELGVALTVPVVFPLALDGSTSTVALLNPPYRAISAGGAKVSGVQAFVSNCNASALNQALACSLAAVPRQTREINGMTLDVSANGDLFGAIVDTLVGPIFGDKVANGIKNNPIGKIASHALPLALGGVPLYAADKLGVVDGVVSSFGVGKASNSVHPMAHKALGIATKYATGVAF